MSRESKKVKPLREKELDLVVGGVGAYTNNFFAQCVATGNGYIAPDGYRYGGGLDGLSSTGGKGNYLMISVSSPAGQSVAGWNFKFGFPDQSWANTYAGGAADFKAAFIDIWGSAKWKGWGSTQTVTSL